MTTCPECGKSFNYLEAMMDDEWRHIIKMLPDFEGHGRLVFEYIELFSVTPLRMKSKKIYRLLKQVREFFNKGEFPYRKKLYKISKAGIVQALQVTCNKNFATPLEDHNYLKKVMISISEDEARDQSIATEKKLREKEKHNHRKPGEGKPGRHTTDEGRETVDEERVSYQDFIEKQDIKGVANSVLKDI